MGTAARAAAAMPAATPAWVASAAMGCSTMAAAMEAVKARVGVDAVHAWAAEQGYESIRFECHNQHRPMLHLAIARMYDIVGIRWDPDRGDNLVIFEKSLTAP